MSTDNQPRFTAGNTQPANQFEISSYLIDDCRPTEDDSHSGPHWWGRICVFGYSEKLRDRLIELLNRPEPNGPTTDWESLERAEIAHLKDVLADASKNYRLIESENLSLNVQVSLARTMLEGQEKRHKEAIAELTKDRDKWKSLFREQVAATDGWKQSRQKMLDEVARLNSNYLAVMVERDAKETARMLLQSDCDGFRMTIQKLGSAAKDREMSLSEKIAGLRRELEELKASAGVVESWMPKPPQNLREDIIRAINCRSAENESNTPDWILGNFIMASLAAFESAINERTSYYRQPDDSPMTDPPTTTER